MINLLYTFLLLCNSQPLDFHPTDSVQVKGVHAFAADQYENLYLLKFNELIKLDPDRKVVFNYSNPLLGKITGVSVFNPLEPLLFYQDQYSIIVLDNRLNEKRKIKLHDYGLSDIKIISQSDADHIWSYDQATDRLYRLSLRDPEISHKSLPIFQIIGKGNSPVQMETNINRVYLNFPGRGIAIFDAQASFITLIPIKNIKHFHLKDDHIIFIKEEALYSYNIENSNQKLLLPGLRDFESVTATSGKILLFSPPWIKIFTGF